MVGQNHMLTCEATVWGTGCAMEAYFIYRETQLISTNRTIEFKPLKLSDISLYTCIVTLAGYNFTSRPAFMPEISQSEFTLSVCGVPSTSYMQILLLSGTVMQIGSNTYHP